MVEKGACFDERHLYYFLKFLLPRKIVRFQKRERDLLKS